jgi:hypothetical protein
MTPPKKPTRRPTGAPTAGTETPARLPVSVAAFKAPDVGLTLTQGELAHLKTLRSMDNEAAGYVIAIAYRMAKKLATRREKPALRLVTGGSK